MGIIDLITEDKICSYPDAVAFISSQFDSPVPNGCGKPNINMLHLLKWVPDHFSFTNLSRLGHRQNDKNQELKV